MAGSRDRIAALRDARGVLGGIVDPQNAYLLERGLKTLGLRVAQQNATGMAVAQFLEADPAIERVWYPGLPSHPDHAIAVGSRDNLVRFAIGVEDTADLIADLSRALGALR